MRLTGDVRERGETLPRVLVVGVDDYTGCCNGTPRYTAVISNEHQELKFLFSIKEERISIPYKKDLFSVSPVHPKLQRSTQGSFVLLTRFIVEPKAG